MKKINCLVMLCFGLPAHAVSLSPNGVGEVILVPYFTAAEGMNTYVTISNTTDVTKVVKVRFIDGSWDYAMRSFNLFLSPRDTFAFSTGLVADSPLVGSPSEGGIYFSDDSCVFGVESGEQFDFSPEYPQGTHVNTREGSIQMLEMGEILSGWTPCTSTEPETGINQRMPPTGGLKATASIINVANGFQFSYQPVAFDDFYSNTEPQVFRSQPADDVPSLNDAGLVTAGVTYETGFDAFLAAITSSQVINDFNIEPAVAAQTEWVLHIPNALGIRLAGFGPCFQASVARLYDRKGRVLALQDGPIDQQSTTPTTDLELCHSINVLRFGDHSDDGILNSVRETDFSSDFEITTGESLINGQLELDFADPDNPRLFAITGSTDTGTVVTTGAPVIGFAVQKFHNAAAQPGLLAAYATAYPHTLKRQREEVD
jgi:hypothetical protein